MTNEHFLEQLTTVAKFTQIYCDDNHKNEPKTISKFKTIYKGVNLDKFIEYNLCKECEHLLLYTNERLQNCPHKEKPKCRKCPHICYEKNELKHIIKVMKSSGIKLGLSKIKSFFKS